MTSSNTPDYPEYKFVPTTITANGDILAQQYQDKNGTVITDISLSQENIDRKNKLQNLLEQYEDSVNIFSPELTSQMDSIATAKKKSAIADFESMYEPASRNAREDYFARLGTLDSTAYLDRFNQLEKTKQQAYADIANDYVANLQELQNNELSNRYAYLNYLQNGLNSVNNLNNNYINTVSSLSSSYTNNYNNYLNNLYGSQSKNNNNNWWSNSLVGNLLDFGSTKL
jgi:hypothetical protein